MLLMHVVPGRDPRLLGYLRGVELPRVSLPHQM